MRQRQDPQPARRSNSHSERCPDRKVMSLSPQCGRGPVPGGGTTAPGVRARSHSGRDASRAECQGSFLDAPANRATRIAPRMHQPRLTPPAALNQAPQVRRELERELLRLFLYPARGTLLLAASPRGAVSCFSAKRAHSLPNHPPQLRIAEAEPLWSRIGGLGHQPQGQCTNGVQPAASRRSRESTDGNPGQVLFHPSTRRSGRAVDALRRVRLVGTVALGYNDAPRGVAQSG